MSQQVEAPVRDAQVELSEIVLDGPLKNMAQAWAIARVLAQSSMVPYALRGSPQNCLVTMMLGQELGLTWTQATRGIYVLPNGTPGLRGQLLLALIRKAGHRFRFERAENTCKCIITRGDEDHKFTYEGEFGLDDAKAARLVYEKDGKLIARSAKGEPLPWEQYRRDMLQWRAVARAAGIGAPEVIYGFDLAGLGGEETPGTLTAEVLPAPQAQGDAAQVRQQLAELDRQHAVEAIEKDLAETAHHMDAWAGGREIHREEAADYEVGKTGEDTGPRAPGLPDLHELLRKCGFPGAAQTRVCAALAHKDISDMSQLTPGEIFMVHDTITRVAWGKTSMKERHDALERYLETAEGVEQDDVHTDAQ